MARIIPWLLKAIGLIAFLLLGAVLLINFLGRREWEKTRARIEASGETLEIEKLLPPPVPDDQNFAMAPLLRPLLDYELDWKTKQPTWRDPEGKERADGFKLSPSNAGNLPKADWMQGEAVDLNAWAEFFRKSDAHDVPTDLPAAETVLAALGRFDAELQEIADAAQRPFARFPLHYDEGPYAAFPHLNILLEVVRQLSLRASARLAVSQTPEAADDVLLTLRIVWLLRDDLTLINHLVTLTSLKLSLQPVWEGLQRRQWQAPQLEAIQASLEKIDLLASYRSALRGEAAFMGTNYDFLRERPHEIEEMSGLADPESHLSFKLWPKGVFYMNEAYQARIFFDVLLPAIDADEHRIAVETIDRLETDIDHLRASRFRFDRMFALISLPVYVAVTERAAQAVAYRDLTIVALALARFRLEKNRLPVTLEELAPPFLSHLPSDVTTGDPLHYHQDGDDFVLYTAGLNRTDEGGNIALKKGGGIDRTAGDWVWPRSDPPPTADH